MLISGTVFIADLRRRALADRRMVLFETTLIAGISATVLSADITPWGVEWRPTNQLVLNTVLVAVAWTVVAALLSHYATAAYRVYAESILVETGLLYLALEHEPAEMLGSLKAAEKMLRLSPATAPSSLSFRHRIIALLRRFSACASGIGFYPQPTAWRIARVILLGLALSLGVIFSVVTWYAWQGARVGLGPEGWQLKTSGITLVWIVMLLTILGSSARTAPVMALADVLLGEDQTGTAVRAGHNL